MDAAQLIDLCSTTGFPIVMCCFLLYYIKDRDVKMQESFDKMTEAFIEFKTLFHNERGDSND